jgi:hypothetical protein
LCASILKPRLFGEQIAWGAIFIFRQTVHLGPLHGVIHLWLGGSCLLCHYATLNFSIRKGTYQPYWPRQTESKRAWREGEKPHLTTTTNNNSSGQDTALHLPVSIRPTTHNLSALPMFYPNGKSHAFVLWTAVC